jgi:uncharacterized membrane protein
VKIKWIGIVVIMAMIALFAASAVIAQVDTPPDSTSQPANPPVGYEYLFNALLLLVPVLIVPLVALIKTWLKINDSSFYNYIIQVVLCFALAWLLALLMVPNWNFMDLVKIVFIFFPISTGVHAGWKQSRAPKPLGTAFRPA